MFLCYLNVSSQLRHQYQLTLLINFSRLPPGSSVESMRYTAQLDEACRLLAETSEVQSDILIFHLVKLQQISRKIKHTFYDLEVGFGPRVVPRKMCIDLLQRELESFKHELPENLRSNC